MRSGTLFFLGVLMLTQGLAQGAAPDRPFVAGYDRFHAGKRANAAAGGRHSEIPLPLSFTTTLISGFVLLTLPEFLGTRNVTLGFVTSAIT